MRNNFALSHSFYVSLNNFTEEISPEKDCSSSALVLYIHVYVFYVINLSPLIPDTFFHNALA